MTKYITLAQLREKLSGRARNSIFRDIEKGQLPGPLRLGQVNYWVEDEVDAALSVLANVPSAGGASDAE